MTNEFNHIARGLTYHFYKALFPAVMLFMAFSVHAQHPSDKGWFEADAISGCAPIEINITNLGVRTGTLFVDWEGDPNDRFNTSTGFTDAFVANQVLTHTYNNPGTYLIRTVDGSSDPNVQNRFDFLTITVVEAVAPDFQVALCSGNQVTLTFNFGADNYDFYEIDYGDGSPMTTLDKSGNNSVSYAYGTQSTYAIEVAGRITGGNNVNCANAPPVTITTLDNIPVPSITGLSAQSNTTLALNYAALDPNINYDLELDNGSGFNSFRSIDPQVNPTTITIDDPSIDNSVNTVSLRIVASDACGTSQEISNEVSSIAFTTQTLSTTNTLNIDYRWNTSAVDFNDIELVQNGNTQFTSTQNQSNQEVNYTNCTEVADAFMQKTDANGTSVRSLSITPLANQTLDLPQMATPSAVLNGSNVELTFQQTLFPFSMIRIYRQNSNGDYVQIGTSTQLNYVDLGVSGQLTEACYRTDYLDECGNTAQQSAEVCVPLAGLLRAPSAFSPNGDSVNDEFTVGYGVFDDFQLTIFNKWGNLVFQSKDVNRPWDGNYNGQEAPNGTYTYKVSYNRNGERVFSTGTVTIIR